MTEFDFNQWTADNDRLVIAGLSNTGPGLLDYDEDTLEAVRQRCVVRFGKQIGNTYYQNLIGTLPSRRPELFPELFE